MLPLRFAPERRARADKDAAQTLCTALGLPQDVLSTPAGRLSVGQQQRVAAARALIGTPSVIVADEPTSALDAATQGTFLKLLFEQTHRAGTALLMVSHDARLGERFDRVVNLEDIVTTQRSAA
jgi:putative ABC transport system ATP-binding protein